MTVSGTLSNVPGDDLGELVSVSVSKSEENGAGSVSISKNVITIAAKGVSKMSGSCGDTPAKASTTTLTLHNNHGTTATLTYTFVKTSGGGSVSPASGSVTIAAGGTTEFQVTSAAPDTAAETKATLTPRSFFTGFFSSLIFISCLTEWIAEKRNGRSVHMFIPKRPLLYFSS